MKGLALSVAMLLCCTSMLHAAAITPARAIAATHTCSYPQAEAGSPHQEGKVLVRYDINADGNATHVVVAKSSGSMLLDGAAIRCVAEHWKSVPATRDGVRTASPNHKVAIIYRSPKTFVLPGYVVPAFLAFAASVVLVSVMSWRRDPPADRG